MILNPQPGRRVRIRYRPSLRPLTLSHGTVGTVITPGGGKPRKHLVRLDDGRTVVIPAGQIFPLQESGAEPHNPCVGNQN